ncbi:hypothetical protein BDQ17DRAFT_1332519 [Cyathus striatus]|nr:hypothetical protein BDQ17DRAFT_1332519 [Cyathus striatus]
MPPRRSTGNKSTNINATTTSGNTDNPPEPSNTRKRTVSSTEGTTQPAKKKGKKESTVEEESEGNSAKKRKGKKGRGHKSATQHIAEDASASSPVKLTRAEQNIIDDGTSVAPPKQICNAVAPVATSGHTGNQTSKDTRNKSNEDTGDQTSKDTHKRAMRILVTRPGRYSQQEQ